MKFGKTIQSQQVPGWGEYYLNYKALKKIINSYAAGRPASDASLLSLGLRPAKKSPGSGSNKSDPDAGSLSPPHLQQHDTSITPSSIVEDLEPLPAESEPPAPNTGSALMSRDPTGGNDRSESFKAHRDVFFFTLQRELEKINTFYLVKERDLRLRLLTLLSNRKRLLQNSSGSGTPGEDSTLDNSTRKDAEWISLEEGWRLFERDLGKLQGFIEINATGFRKILKKWDKRSKSNTKELYIERQVEVQPCFNREFIAKLSDIVTANLLDIENGSEHLSTSFLEIEHNLPESIGADGLNLGSGRKGDFGEIDVLESTGNSLALDALVDLDSNMLKAFSSGKDAILDWLRIAKAKQNQYQRQDKSTSTRLMRILWRAAQHVPQEYLDMVLNAVTLDYNYIDNINGRSPAHQAAINGSLTLIGLCAQNNVGLLEKPDAYDRRPIHYASMHGHSEIVSFLLSQSVDPSATDKDGYTPLMHAITQGHLEVVRIFVQDKLTLEPTAISNDLIPLSLACQYGHLEVARLLLQCGAKVIPNSEGLYPQHFAAKAGHEQICRLLVEEGGPDGGGKDRQDKYNLWTPLHHAAIGGQPQHLACIKVLVEAGCNVNAADEYGKSPGWYSAWFGHVECLNYLLDSGAKLNGNQNTLQGMENLGLAADPQMDSLSPGSDLMLDPPADEFELIPSLSLPPPIIPLRVYGHEFLANRCLIQLSLGHPFTRPSSSSKAPPIKLYSRSGQDPLNLWSSLKLVMTSKSDISAVPHSVILPLADEREVFSFQVQSLETFTLELSLYPTFGSKVIGRAIVLPATFNDVTYHKGIVAPLLDHNLKTIGEVAFEVSCIKPFQGAQLEIGGRVETYWKSKVTPSQPTQDHAHQFQSHRPLSVSTSSPSLRPPAITSAPSSNTNHESALVTASSLSGEYVHVVVQVTKDGVPVIYPNIKLPVDNLDITVSDVTLEQFLLIGKSQNLLLDPSSSSLSSVEWSSILSKTMSTLDSILNVLPSDIGLNLLLQYLRPKTIQLRNYGKSIEINKWVDTILHSIYENGKAQSQSQQKGRKFIFSSFEPEVATALNWKQPNYAVFFASNCGISSSSSSTPSTTTTDRKRLIPISQEEETDLRCLSVREAVNFAKSTNLLGVILEATTLAAVPSLVASVKDAGLLLATFGDTQDITSLRQGASDGRTIDAFVIDGTPSPIEVVYSLSDKFPVPGRTEINMKAANDETNRNNNNNSTGGSTLQVQDLLALGKRFEFEATESVSGGPVDFIAAN
ncbi:cyclin-dependent protein kinase inhibitor [Kwoniella mangroviensis CBS 10435]|uniref:Cyclin-dependent protein kinase inhibitor n=1 Tax=Kwoniella mangroviensis CBS 10435 TaxID=1331196 RepID=A0A1B9J1Y4_9TREE|nr:cyclin-dependent protein kinase inhibitor [Kwoniella mangroviensis CBS 10435]